MDFFLPLGIILTVGGVILTRHFKRKRWLRKSRLESTLRAYELEEKRCLAEIDRHKKLRVKVSNDLSDATEKHDRIRKHMREKQALEEELKQKKKTLRQMLKNVLDLEDNVFRQELEKTDEQLEAHTQKRLEQEIGRRERKIGQYEQEIKKLRQKAKKIKQAEEKKQKELEAKERRDQRKKDLQEALDQARQEKQELLQMTDNKSWSYDLDEYDLIVFDTNIIFDMVGYNDNDTRFSADSIRMQKSRLVSHEDKFVVPSIVRSEILHLLKRKKDHADLVRCRAQYDEFFPKVMPEYEESGKFTGSLKEEYDNASKLALDLYSKLVKNPLSVESGDLLKRKNKELQKLQSEEAREDMLQSWDYATRKKKLDDLFRNVTNDCLIFAAATALAESNRVLFLSNDTEMRTISGILSDLSDNQQYNFTRITSYDLTRMS